mmetsp:Transcript_30648/g.66906  ORF Transcript_30648/g.66906 Transcript_30648/m.66906 type:complete len:108 (-) Transcript_30648:335-658(-)
MLIESWDEFFQQVEALFRAEPLRTRMMTKYRHCDGKLEIKVTDDKVCLQFRTEQAQDLKRIEKLNQLFFALTVHGEDTNVADYLPEAPAAQPTSTAQSGKRRAGRRQ